MKFNRFIRFFLRDYGSIHSRPTREFRRFIKTAKDNNGALKNAQLTLLDGDLERARTLLEDANRQFYQETVVTLSDLYAISGKEHYLQLTAVYFGFNGQEFNGLTNEIMEGERLGRNQLT